MKKNVTVSASYLAKAFVVECVKNMKKLEPLVVNFEEVKDFLKEIVEVESDEEWDEVLNEVVSKLDDETFQYYTTLVSHKQKFVVIVG